MAKDIIGAVRGDAGPEPGDTLDKDSIIEYARELGYDGPGDVLEANDYLAERVADEMYEQRVAQGIS